MVARAILLIAMICGIASQAEAGRRFDYVVVIVLENNNFATAMKQPFMAKLASRGALLTNYWVPVHPSQPNYIALVSGSTHDVEKRPHPNAIVTLDVSHLGDLLERKGLGWKVYAEGYPGGCFLGPSKGRYFRKHVPFLSFRNVQASPDRCSRIVPAKEFAADRHSGHLPAFSLYIPDVDNDGHDTSAKFADKWLGENFSWLMTEGPSEGTLYVVTFDEGLGTKIDEPSHIFTLLLGNMISPGSQSGERYSHYDLLRTIEDNFGIGTLGLNDDTASPITGIWR